MGKESWISIINLVVPNPPKVSYDEYSASWQEIKSTNSDAKLQNTLKVLASQIEIKFANLIPKKVLTPFFTRVRTSVQNLTP